MGTEARSRWAYLLVNKLVSRHGVVQGVEGDSARVDLIAREKHSYRLKRVDANIPSILWASHESNL